LPGPTLVKKNVISFALCAWAVAIRPKPASAKPPSIDTAIFFIDVLTLVLTRVLNRLDLIGPEAVA
jgi:hypothetical protein